MLTDSHNAQGVLVYTARRNGVIIAIEDGPNLITRAGRETDARRLGGADADVITHIGFGTGSAAPDLDDVALTNGYWKPIGEVTYPAIGKVRFAFQLGVLEANGLAIREFGLRTASGVLYARKIRALGPIAKAADVDVSGHWTITY